MLEPATRETVSYADDLVNAGQPTEPAPHLILAMDSQRPLSPTARISIGDVHEVIVGRGDAPSVHHVREKDGQQLCVSVADGWMSGTHARLVRGHGWWMIEDAGSKNGTRVNGSKISRLPLTDGDLIETGGTFFLFDAGTPRLTGEPSYVDSNSFAKTDPAMATLNIELARQLNGLRRIAPSPVPVVILGESGTGKELTVRALHEMSRRDGKLVVVNCGAIPDTLIESELFGHKRGAFSGANEDRPGLIRSADGGTLFLDEVAELPQESQSALLRFLQEGEVRPIGDTSMHTVNTRVVAATHQDLAERVRLGTFRRDLYARLAGFRVELPPLRERREDVGGLVTTLLRDIAGDDAETIRFRTSAARALFEYDFPLNIRELRHALQSAIVIAEGEAIAGEHLPESLLSRPVRSDAPLEAKDRSLRDEVTQQLRTHSGNVSAVARTMGKAPVQIRRWCRRFHIDLAEYRR